MGLERWISKWKQRPDRKLNLAQKILWNHALSEDGEYMKLMPDRVAMQDASAQMAILQFMLAKKERTAVPSSIHCDHLIKAEKGADLDLAKAIKDEDEIFNFLQNAAEKYGISFWKPGSGIIHQIVLENYATPGGLMLGTDSHTPNAGGLGMLAIGVGGADAVDAMVGIPWELKRPKVMGIHLHGKLSGWASPKDVILTIAEKLTVQGGTHYILEYFGDGIDSLSCTGMATICNMGAEVGATSSLFPFTMAMSNYLRMNGRGNVADLAGVAHQKGLLSADANADYDQIIDIDLNRLEPRINGPFSPDISTTISQFKHRVHEKGWKDQVAAGLIGSCTNSSYEDMSKCSDIIRQAEEKGLKPKSQFLVTPGSEQIRATIERDGYINSFQSAGAEILSNACGPCIGQWKRDSQAEENAILTSFNRNFRGRNDGQAKTMNFLASPEIVTAMVYSGKLSFNPITDYLELKDGSKFRFQPPRSMELPASGFEKGRPDLQPLESQPNRNIEVTIDQNSSRLQLLDPFEAWDGKEFSNLRVLVKIVGKCTTDHISAAGPWLKYKGHLDNIANNTLIGAQNAFNGKINWVKNEFTNTEDTIPNVARDYKSRNQSWVVVADQNYGEGSAREHAALQPRYLGCKMIVARSFARIHETNLKKQGIVPVTFLNPEDYDKIKSGSIIETLGLKSLAPGSTISLKLYQQDGSIDEIPVIHTMSKDQIQYFKHGSALNLIAHSTSLNTGMAYDA